MGELLEKLGIDWKLLLAQVINFGILLWLLQRFAYRPILGVLERRRQTIAQSLEAAKQIEAERTAVNEQKSEVLRLARVEAQGILDAARTDAAALLERQRAEAQAEAAAAIHRAQREAERIKDGVVQEAQAELAELVVASAEKVIRVKLNDDADRQLVNQALKRSIEDRS